ncbi:MAG: hypothetical protein WAW85_16100, partial [Gordonia sp. (in: high G+C Gram-positive bacteria)]|uniref:hypothetical protein n=1 Tax=Gordonia sp. (in: high G+C Gram-positive bacteria) TaxID=84139 RepID=UPI003BB693E5
MTPRQRDRVRSLVAESEAPIDAQTIASTLDIHVTTARFHLNNLVAEGSAVTIALPPDGVGRPRVGYRVVVAPPIDDLVVMLIMRLGETPEAREALSVDVGRAWAAKHLPVESWKDDAAGSPDPLVIAETILTRLGFRITGVLSAFGDHEITLGGCPMQELEADLPEVARGVVRGILEEALATGAPQLSSRFAVTVTPDARAGACELHLQ